jgi:hypothetical protein
MISLHENFLRSAGTVSPETTGFPFNRLLRLAGITVEVFLPTSTRGRQRINEHRTQTSIPPVGFDPTISVLERAKTVRALDRATTAIGT